MAAAQDDPGPAKAIGVQLRYALIGGDLVSGESWHDLFRDSTGIGLQYTMLWRTSKDIQVGWYTGISFDQFPGDESSVTIGSGAHVLVDPETMTLQRHTLGVAARLRIGALDLQPRFGIGFAIYDRVDADVRSGSMQFEVHAIEPSIEFTLEVGVASSMVVSERLNITVGLTYEWNNPPSDSPDLGIDGFDAQENVVLDLGLKYAF